MEPLPHIYDQRERERCPRFEPGRVHHCKHKPPKFLPAGVDVLPNGRMPGRFRERYNADAKMLILLGRLLFVDNVASRTSHIAPSTIGSTGPVTGEPLTVIFRESRYAKALLLLGLLAVMFGASTMAIDPVAADSVSVSPGAHSGYLGTDEDTVALDYPKSAIMMNSTGDLVFNLTLTMPHTLISVYVPPEFVFVTPDTTSVWTSITNDYNNIFLSTVGSDDSIAPDWWVITIANETVGVGTYQIRLFDVRAPNIQGRYFFKVFLDSVSIGASKFPTLVVKGSLDPAYVSGRILCGLAANCSYGQPVNALGKVTAVGTTLDGRAVKAQAYFNATDGSYTLYGLAAGTYALTAYAAGFVPTALPQLIGVASGQSLDGVDIHLRPAARIEGTALSKLNGAAVVWSPYRSIRIELTDSQFGLLAFINSTFSATSDSFNFAFNMTDLDGHLPQDYAGYVSGVENGEYLLNAYVNGYIQTAPLEVSVANQTRIRGVTINLSKRGWLEVIVHFKDLPPQTDGSLTVDAYAADGTFVGSNVTTVPSGVSSWGLEVTGISNSTRDYGLPDGTYNITATFTGYVQQESVHATLVGYGVIQLSVVTIRSGSASITVRSVDWERPSVETVWAYPDAPVTIEVDGPQGQMNETVSQPQPPQTMLAVNVTDLGTGMYSVHIYTVGYLQNQSFNFSVRIGATADLSVELVKGSKIDVEAYFLSEGLVSQIDTYLYNETRIPVRVEVYDLSMHLLGANVTYTMKSVSFEVEVVGFNRYAGDPAQRWVNYYDTTDAFLQDDYGLAPGTYLVKVWVPGYQLESEPVVSVPQDGAAHVIVKLDRLSRVHGFISGFDAFDELLPLSWATVALNETKTYSLDGYFELWLPEGRYIFSSSSIGYTSQAFGVSVGPGSDISLNVVMTRLDATNQ